VVMDRMDADSPQTFRKTRKRVGNKRCRQNNDVDSAKIERVVSSPAARPRMFLKKFVNDFYRLSSQAINGSKVPHINTGQLLGQNRFVAGEGTPMRKIIGEALADKVMLLERPEGVLKDRIIRTLTYCVH